ncbi:uncharacterized protein C10orf67, mitochondrial-like [Clytia hemisphaerica]|uniref:DUF4709 domain-containing protein n=1 Tax=Clytia hemisphaerica TaxID=252671 RepID=A0A7M5WQ80_9CNID
MDDENDEERSVSLETGEVEDAFGETFIPSISDRLQIGYAASDKACQTQASEIINLKKMSDVLGIVIKDISMLKRSLYFSKLTLQAEYDGRLEAVAFELYNRVNKRVAEIEAIHKERIDVIRRSYKQQMSNALAKLSRDYQIFYGDKDAILEAENRKKLEEMNRHKEMMRKNELAQKEMYEMLQMQMEEDKAKQEIVPSRKSSAASIGGFLDEIDELNTVIKGNESRIYYLEECLEEIGLENKKMTTELEDKNEKLRAEKLKSAALRRDLDDLKQAFEREKEESRSRLEAQRKSLTIEMKNRLDEQKTEHQRDLGQKMESLKEGQNEQMRHQKFAEEARLKAALAKQEENKVVVEVPTEDTDLSRLQMLEKRQRAEIARLYKKLEALSAVSDMKIRVLNEHIHSLKDEMFLRQTLHRQTAKVKQATVTYVRRGSEIVPMGLQPMAKLVRRHVLPSIISAPSTANSVNPIDSVQQVKKQ